MILIYGPHWFYIYLLAGTDIYTYIYSPAMQPITCGIQGGGQVMAVMAKILATTIQVNLYCLLHVSIGLDTNLT